MDGALTRMDDTEKDIEPVTFEAGKQTLREERQELERARRELERARREFAIQKRIEKRQREKEKQLFEMKWKILEEEIKKLAKEREQAEKQRNFYKYIADKEQEEKDIKYVRGEMFFIGVENAQELKKRYKDLLKIFHPDNLCGDTETLQEINREYDRLREQIK